MTTIAAPKTRKDPFVLKGGVFTLTTIVLHTTQIQELESLLVEKIKIAPKFFHCAPVVVDCSPIVQSEIIDFKAINQLLRKHHLIPIGIRGVRQEWQAQAIEHSFAIMPESRHAHERPITIPSAFDFNKAKESTPAIQTPAAAHVDSISGSPTKVITLPIRSGQQIYAPGGDLLVLAPVSHGAELLADGNIYVFGPLRGRALAGITGDQSAMIFCKSLEAELVSIAGQYKISEDLKETCWQQAVRIQLQSGRLQFSEL